MLSSDTIKLMFDTHCHLNFGAFDGKVPEIVEGARSAGVTHITVPGTDLPTSQKAVDIANKFPNVYAAVGIHPHHIFELQQKGIEAYKKDIDAVEALLADPKTVAIGEVGLDRHYYAKTKYEDYVITEEFIKTQCEIFAEHVNLALKHKKSLIIHHREAKQDLLKVLTEVWSGSLARNAVIHCCEPDPDLLEFAKQHKLFIGIDGDVTYDRRKWEFIAIVPLDMLVMETDSPFLIPEPYHSKPRDERGPNVPAYIVEVAKKVAKVQNISVEDVQEQTLKNALELFQLT